MIDRMSFNYISLLRSSMIVSLVLVASPFPSIVCFFPSGFLPAPLRSH